MNYLFFDTETNGLPVNYKASIHTKGNWPKILQLAFILTDETGESIVECSEVIKWEGLKLDQEAFKTHGIDQERIDAEGVSFDELFADLQTAANESEQTVFIAHNFAFDSKVLGAEMMEQGLQLPKMKHFCTMLHTSGVCKIPGPHGFKWPKLQELHKFLFGAEFDNAHDALADVKATARCFFELKKRGLLPDFK